MLDEHQMLAVAHERGPVIVLAGPGSGKTRVIIARIKYLIDHNIAGPEDLLLITYTDYAVKEMKRRIAELGTTYALPIRVATFHSFFYSVCREFIPAFPHTLPTPSQRANLLQEVLYQIPPSILQNMNIPLHGEQREETLRYLLAQIQKYKEYPEGYTPSYAGMDWRLFMQLYEAYQKQMESDGYLDYEDMLQRANALLASRQDIREILWKRHKFILVDEFQDVNRIQYDSLRLLGSNEWNMMVVGDDDQAIYGFRGSKPDYLTLFQKEYCAKVISLQMNYRCPKAVTEVSQKLIRHNSMRMDKDLRASKSDDLGYYLQVMHSQDDMWEKLSKDLEEIWKYSKEGKSIAVICRSNRECKEAMHRLESIGLPLYDPKAVYSKEGLDLLRNYSNLCAKQQLKRKQYFQLFREYEVPILRAPFTRESSLLDDLQQLYEGSDAEVQIKQFCEDYYFAASLPPYGMLHFLLHARKGVEQVRLPQKSMYLHEAKKYQTIREYLHWLDEIEKSGNQGDKATKPARCVQIMTAHASKGLEFNHVLIPNICKGGYPAASVDGQYDLEEERRILYVAMTRAVESLHLYGIQKPEDHEASGFVKEFL